MKAEGCFSIVTMTKQASSTLGRQRGMIAAAEQKHTDLCCGVLIT